MKNHFMRRLAVFCVLAFGIGMLAGCETCKGLNRDIKSADTWMRDNLW